MKAAVQKTRSGPTAERCPVNSRARVTPPVKPCDKAELMARYVLVVWGGVHIIIFHCVIFSTFSTLLYLFFPLPFLRFVLLFFFFRVDFEFLLSCALIQLFCVSKPFYMFFAFRFLLPMPFRSRNSISACLNSTHVSEHVPSIRGCTVITVL